VSQPSEPETGAGAEPKLAFIFEEMEPDAPPAGPMGKRTGEKWLNKGFEEQEI
jgi:hypothetical protein